MADNKNTNNLPQMKIGKGGNKNFKIKEKPKDFKGTVKKLIKEVAEFKWLFIGICILVLITTVLNLSTNVFIEKIVKGLGEYNIEAKTWVVFPDKDLFLKYLILLIIVCILFCIFRYCQNLANAYLSNKLLLRLRIKIFNKTVKFPIRYVDTHKHGDIMSRCINDTDTVVTAINSSVESLLGGIVTLLGCLGLMIYYSPLLSLVCIAVLILSFTSTTLISKAMTPMHIKQHALLGKLNAETEEMVSGSKTVIAYNQQKRAFDKFSKQSDEMSKVGCKAQIIGGSMGPMMNFVGNLGYFLICIFGALLIMNNKGTGLLGQALTVSVVVTFLHTVKQFTRPINEIAQVLPNLVSATAAAEPPDEPPGIKNLFGFVLSLYGLLGNDGDAFSYVSFL
mgnify:CR=1 FL=1